MSEIIPRKKVIWEQPFPEGTKGGYPPGTLVLYRHKVKGLHAVKYVVGGCNVCGRTKETYGTYFVGYPEDALDIFERKLRGYTKRTSDHTSRHTKS